MFFSNGWWLIPACLVPGGVIVWVRRHFNRIAERTRVAEERRQEIVGQLARGEPLEAILALLTRSLEESFSRVRCRFTLAGPVYSPQAFPSEKTCGTVFPVVDTKGSFLGELKIDPAVDELTREEIQAVEEIRRLAAMIAEQQSIYGELQIHAKQDRLTGLINASTFDDTFGSLIEAALPETTLALFVFHLDGLRRIYDRLGRSAGDIHLQQAATSIERCFRAGDLVARLGSDAFAALATGLSAAEAGRVCQSVVNAFSDPFDIEGLRIASSVRIGVSAFPQGGRTPAELRLSAEAALKDAKKGSGSRFTISSREIRERARSIVVTERLILQALDDNHFDLIYQPQLMLNGEWAGMEAVARVRQPEQQLDSKAASSQIGAWILPEAIRQYAEWLRKGLNPVRIAVKCSQLNLPYNEVFDQILRYVKTFELGPEAIQIELPDSATVLSDKTSLKVLWQLRSAGISVILDVLSRGYSSLSCLNGLPVDAIKINKSLVRVLTEGDDSMPLTSAMIASAHALRMSVIAEGVETEEQMWLLRRLGCEVLQGRHIALPLSAKDAGDALSLRLKAGKCRIWSQGRVAQ
jgi:diguanylate cyclase (GGDEF)-like protein